MPKIEPTRAGACFCECLILQVAPPEMALIVAEVGVGLEVPNAEDSIIQSACRSRQLAEVTVSSATCRLVEFFRTG